MTCTSENQELLFYKLILDNEIHDLKSILFFNDVTFDIFPYTWRNCIRCKSWFLKPKTVNYSSNRTFIEVLVFMLFFLLFIERWNLLNCFYRYSHRYCRLICSKSFKKYFLVFLFVCTRRKNKKCFRITASSYLPYLFFCKP